MIDPLRKRQNDERVAKLLAFHREISDEPDLDKQAMMIRAVEAGMAKNWPDEPAFHDEFAELTEEQRQDSLLVAVRLVDLSLDGLAKAIRSAHKPPILFEVNGKNYELREPRPEPSPLVMVAPFTSYVCPELLEDVHNLDIVVFDPGARKELAIERGFYARERTRLILVEHFLWEIAARHGGLSNRVPYVHRSLLLLRIWHPSAHTPDESERVAWTLCARCGKLLTHRRQLFKTLPRCAACMKETTTQREWPPHAMAPHRRGTWLLRCQYPDCDMVFEGPRHRKYCRDHVSSKLPPAQRLPRRRDVGA